MICQADAKSLEIYCLACLSQDQILLDELHNKLDLHSLNQKTLGLPEGDLGRLIAKVFVFRLVYGGSAFSYANDPDFTGVSKSETYWQKRIDFFYNKYKGIKLWHDKILQEATTKGRLVMPTGRIYQYQLKRNWKGELVAPQTIIKNYPIQGMGADVMAIARVSFFKRWKEQKIEGFIISTVHDSIVVDVPSYEVERVTNLFHEVFASLHINFEKLFGVALPVEFRCEVKVGKNMSEMD